MHLLQDAAHHGLEMQVHVKAVPAILRNVGPAAVHHGKDNGSGRAEGAC